MPYIKRVIIASIVGLLLVTVGSALAQDAPAADPDADDIWENDTTNLCYTDLAGQCQADFDWEAGWWLQRVAEEDIGVCDVPEKYRGNDGCDGSGAVSVGRFILILQDSPFSPSSGDDVINIASDSVDVNTLGFREGTVFVIYGNDGDNTIVGGSGDDEIYGFGGVDFLFGDPQDQPGSGNDTIDGGDGNDVIIGDSTVDNNSGNDVISGGAGIDVISGDSATGSNNSGNDIIDGGSGNDVITGDGAGNNSGNDTITGGDDNDFILADGGGTDNSGSDSVDGGAGDDLIVGDTFGSTASGGDDTVDGGAGTDTTNAGGGTNVCTNSENNTGC